MSISGAKETIHKAVTAWPGIEVRPRRFGGTEYRPGRREIGHIYGNRLVDIPDQPTPIRIFANSFIRTS